MSRKKLYSTLTKNNDIYTEDKMVVQGIEKIPTPSPSLNVALGGGFPVGYLFQLAGPPSAGKSFLSFVMAECWQKRFDKKSIILVADFEHSITPERLGQFGIDTRDELVYIWKRADNDGAAFFDFLNDEFLPMCKENELRPFVILDSKDTMVPPGEVGRSSSEQEMGSMAKFLKRVLKRTVGLLADAGGSMVIINQLMQQIGVMYGNPDTTSGGNALKHNSILDIWFRKLDTKKELILNRSGTPIGHKMHFKIAKNKTYFPNQEGDILILYRGKIIATHLEIFAMVKDRGVVERPNNRTWIVDANRPEWQFSSKLDFINAIRDNQELNELLIKRCVDSINTTKDITGESDMDDVDMEKVMGTVG